jgi:hypothetical protein
LLRRTIKSMTDSKSTISDIKKSEAPRPDSGSKSEIEIPSTERREELSHPDPTRYGDWERRGRCIDF